MNPQLKISLTIYLIVLFATALLFCNGAVTQKRDSTITMPQAVNLLDKAETVEDYLFLKSAFSMLAKSEPMQWLPYYYDAYCNARLGFLFKHDDDKNKHYAEAAKVAIKEADTRCPANNPAYQAEIYNVYSMAYRVLIAAKPMSNGLKFGNTANHYITQALQLEPENPRSLYLYSQVKYLTPALFGGDKKKAKELCAAALKAFNQQQSGPVLPHWGKKDCELLISKIK